MRTYKKYYYSNRFYNRKEKKRKRKPKENLCNTLLRKTMRKDEISANYLAISVNSQQLKTIQ